MNTLKTVATEPAPQRPPGYGAARPDQSAYQVLQRPEVQRRIQQRIAESRVSADEIIGTLASFMRGRIGDFCDESGEFSIQLAKEREIDHLLKTVTTTTREIKATKDNPAQVVRTCRGQLHSPIQAATVLARIFGLDSRRSRRSLTTGRWPLTTDFASDLAADFKVGAWLEDLIQQQINGQGLSRDAVVDCLLQVRPEIAKYLKEIQTPGQSKDDLGEPDLEERLGLIMDFMIALATDPQASPDNDPVAEAAGQIEALAEVYGSGAITTEAFREALDRINNRLSKPQQQDLRRRLQVKSFILDKTTDSEVVASGPNVQTCQPADIPTPSPVPDEPEAFQPTQQEAAGSDDDCKRPGPNVQTCQRANVPTPSRNSHLLPGLERYILPTDYIGPWPPAHSPASSSEQDLEISQSFSMSSSQHRDRALAPPTERLEDSPSLSMSSAPRRDRALAQPTERPGDSPSLSMLSPHRRGP